MRNASKPAIMLAKSCLCFLFITLSPFMEFGGIGVQANSVKLMCLRSNSTGGMSRTPFPTGLCTYRTPLIKCDLSHLNVPSGQFMAKPIHALTQFMCEGTIHSILYTFMNFWIVNTEPMRPIAIPASVTSINTVPENVSNGTILIKLTPAISLSVI